MDLACCVLGAIIEFVADANVLVQVVPEVTITVFTAVVAFLIIEASRQSALHVFTTEEMAAGPSPKLWNFTLGGASDP
jgi:siroheme synthase